VTIAFGIPRVLCLECGVTRQVQIAFADPRRTYTRAFERYALDLSKEMTIQDVAEHLGIGWDVIKDIQKRYLTRRFSKPKLGKIKRIAIDEISVGKGHRYLTVVLNLDSGAVVFVGQGKGGDALEPFWTRLRHAHARIEAVATDMSPAYIGAVTTHLRGAVLVFDRFHVIKLYNEKLSDFRRALHRQLKDTMEKDVLKGIRWLLLKRPEHLDPARKEPERLAEALKLNEPLAMAYYLKEELTEIWEQEDQETAEAGEVKSFGFSDETGLVFLGNFCSIMRRF
jgi:transposase